MYLPSSALLGHRHGQDNMSMRDRILGPYCHPSSRASALVTTLLAKHDTEAVSLSG